MTPAQPRDFRPLARTSLLAMVVALSAKLGSALALAAHQQIPVELRFFQGWLPYLAFLVARPQFREIAATSTLIMAVVVTLTFAGSIIRARRQQFIAGWLLGPLAIANTLVLDLIREQINPPFWSWQLSRWTCLALMTNFGLALCWLVITRPWRNSQAQG